MRKRVILVVFALLFMIIGCSNKTESSELAEDIFPDTLVLNGGMDTGIVYWGVFLDGASTELEEEDKQLLVPMNSVGTNEWSIQVFQDGILLSEKCTYLLSFDMSSTIDRTFETRLQQQGGSYTGYLEEMVTLSSEMTHYEYEFTMDYKSDPMVRLVFNLGKYKGEDLGEHEVRIDNVSLELIDGTPVSFENFEQETTEARVNQVGYSSDDVKKVVFADIDEYDTFDVVDSNGNVVFTGNIGEEYDNPSSEEMTRLGDFTELTTPGTYTINLGGNESSYPFEINENPYEGVTDATLKMFYYQRSGSDLDSNLIGEYAHAAGHMEDARVYGTDEFIDVSGGWYDAGDYGRYVTAGSKAVIDLFLSYEHFPNSFSDDLGIPESGNGVPDILDEAKYEVEFMLKMQDSKTGGVYHKVTTASFSGEILPEENTEELILSPISAQATADFAAVMAKASSLYKDHDPEFASRCLDASIFAWEWLEANPKEDYFSNPDGIVTGEYGDNNSQDERYFAAAHLYSVTKEEKYHDFIKESPIRIGLGWRDMGYYGVIEYLFLPSDMQDPVVLEKLTNSFIGAADRMVEKSKEDMYEISLNDNYVWGSNMTVANNAMHLIIANQLEENPEYIDYAFEHLNYLLGKNALSVSYITGFGTNQVMNPHHRIIQIVGKPFEGLVIGGPNADLQDPYANKMLEGRADAKCYVDNSQSYSTNEITIYWNSPVVYLLNYFN